MLTEIRDGVYLQFVENEIDTKFQYVAHTILIWSYIHFGLLHNGEFENKRN